MGGILARIAQGDTSAVEECLDLYGGLVWSIARRFSSSNAQAEDAVQEIFLHLWQRAARFDPSKASEKTFIAMIARRRMIDLLRRTANRPRELSLEVLRDNPGSRGDRRLERNLEAKLASRALDELSDAERRAIIMNVCYGYTHVEISQATGTPLGTVKSYISRGLKKARDYLAQGKEARKR
ncbi:MAG TPA: sigma-70 family RNA polymerase sigma factor [Acidobacteriota bacterium]|nr:sigma-70 family RNA polymerase sigma factor [Acidobacteriota bacterium]